MAITNKCPFDPILEVNRLVFNHIKNLHAHSDIVIPLIEAVKPLGDVQIFSPESYHYLTVSTQKIIFGFAVEMDTVAFRLNKEMRTIAIETGGKPFPKCGVDWVLFLPFRTNYPKIDLEFWALKAYVSIRESVGLA